MHHWKQHDCLTREQIVRVRINKVLQLHSSSLRRIFLISTVSYDKIALIARPKHRNWIILCFGLERARSRRVQSIQNMRVQPGIFSCLFLRGRVRKKISSLLRRISNQRQRKQQPAIYHSRTKTKRMKLYCRELRERNLLQTDLWWRLQLSSCRQY